MPHIWSCPILCSFLLIGSLSMHPSSHHPACTLHTCSSNLQAMLPLAKFYGVLLRHFVHHVGPVAQNAQLSLLCIGHYPLAMQSAHVGAKCVACTHVCASAPLGCAKWATTMHFLALASQHPCGRHAACAHTLRSFPPPCSALCRMLRRPRSHNAA